MIPSLDILIRLLIAHLIGDFLLQPKSWVEDRDHKHYKSSSLYLHALVQALLSMVAIADAFHWLVIIILFITHLAIDLFKSYQRQNKTTWFIIDQALHFLVIVVLWKWFFARSYELNMLAYFSNIKILTAILAVLLLSSPTAIFIGMATRKWRKEIEDDKKKTLKDAGLWIGIIERLLIFTFVLVNQYEAVGFLLAAKSIFRFGDLRKTEEKNQTEYVMIGTLLSFGIALMVGFIARIIIL